LRRTYILLAGIPVLIFGLILLLPGSGPVRSPRYVPGAPASVPPYKWNHYGWDADVPFPDGKMWLWTAGTNAHFYLFELNRQVILGELLNGGSPALWRRDSSRVLCLGPDSPGASLKRNLAVLINRLFGKGRLNPNRGETFWILDLAANTATRAGSVEQYPGAGSGWHSSPGARYGYTVPSTAFNSWFVLCDLDQKTFRRMPWPGTPAGWWSEHEILVEAATNTFAAFDVLTQKTSALFGPADFAKALPQDDVAPGTPAPHVRAVRSWNGREYDFYFGAVGEVNGLGAGDSFLLKADRAGPALWLLDAHFKFQWGGHFSEDDNRYLYQGESGKPGSSGNGAVYLRNLTNGVTTTVVPPDNNGQYAIPRFFGNEVIYFRNRLMRRVSLDGSNDALVLP
jgi:hypothetical protein